MPAEPTVIYSAANAQQAHLLKGLLKEQGIAAWVVNEAIQIAGGDLPLGWTAAPKVVVAASDAATARQFAEQFDLRTAHEPIDEDLDTDVAQTGEWAEWPACPQCGELRSARCPVCGVSGSDFPLADIVDDENGTRVFLLCRSCDDHMLPEWYRLCARCGHDYGDGIAVDSESTAVNVTRATLGVVAALVAASAAATGYFVWLFRR